MIAIVSSTLCGRVMESSGEATQEGRGWVQKLYLSATLHRLHAHRMEMMVYSRDTLQARRHVHR